LDGIDLDAASAALVVVLEDGPLRDDAFLAALRASGAWDGFDDLSDDDMALEVEELLTDDVWRTQMAMWAATDPLLEGRVFTHRVTQAEVDAGALEMLPDLTVVDINRPRGIDLADGSGMAVASYDAPLLAVDDEFAGGMFRGPDGWLSGFAAGDVIGLRRLDGRLAIERVDAGALPDATSPEAAELAAHFRDCFNRWSDDHGDELMAASMDVMVERPDAFLTPTLPLQELAAVAGLERRRLEFGPADRPWKTAMQGALSRDAAEMAAEVSKCCGEAFTTASDAFIDWLEQPADTVLAATQVGDVRSALAHGNAAALLGDLQRDRYRQDDALERFIEALGGAGNDKATGPLQYLLGRSAELQKRPAEAGEHFAAALATEPGLLDAAEELGYLASDRGDVLEAQRLFHLAEGPAAWVECLDELVPNRATAGRNEPCPCGSGRKFKQCCLVTPKLPVEQRGRWYLMRLARHLINFHGHLLDRVYQVMSDLESDSYLGEPLLTDLAIVLGGVVDDYLETYEGGLTDVDRTALEGWRASQLQILTVVDRSAGSCRLKNAAGEIVSVRDDLRLNIDPVTATTVARIVTLGSTQYVTASLGVAADDLDELTALLADEDASTSLEEWAWWYRGTLEALPFG